MTIDYSVYLGPYLMCEYTIVEAEEVRRQCSNKECDEIGRRVISREINYCSSCGSSIINVKRPITIPSVDSWSIEDEIGQALHTVPTEYIELDKPLHFWVPNLHRGALRKFWVNLISEQLVAEIDHKMVPSEKLWLVDAFRKEIAILQKRYKQCRIKWGLIVYTS